MAVAQVLRVFSLLVSLFGVVSGVFKLFYPELVIETCTTGFVAIFYNVLTFVADLGAWIQLPAFFESRLGFLYDARARGVFLMTIGLLLGGHGPLYVASWIIFWLVAGIYICLFFIIGDRAAKSDFRAMPENSDAHAQPDSDSMYK
jgi:hypothetical protein